MRLATDIDERAAKRLLYMRQRHDATERRVEAERVDSDEGVLQPNDVDRIVFFGRHEVS
jgi:hypothetical protein